VPRHFAVQAMGNDLLTAEVTVEAASKPDPAIFDLPGGPAEPGMTLKPLHMFQVKGLDLSSSFAYIGNTSSARVLRQVIDRQGNVRETELISAPDMDFVEPVMNGFRRVRSSPPTIDESPCELVWHLYY